MQFIWPQFASDRCGLAYRVAVDDDNLVDIARHACRDVRQVRSSFNAEITTSLAISGSFPRCATGLPWRPHLDCRIGGKGRMVVGRIPESGANGRGCFPHTASPPRPRVREGLKRTFELC